MKIVLANVLKIDMADLCKVADEHGLDVVADFDRTDGQALDLVQALDLGFRNPHEEGMTPIAKQALGETDWASCFVRPANRSESAAELKNRMIEAMDTDNDLEETKRHNLGLSQDIPGESGPVQGKSFRGPYTYDPDVEGPKDL